MTYDKKRSYVRLTDLPKRCSCGGIIHAYSDQDDYMIYSTVAWCDTCKKHYTYEELLLNPNKY